MSSVRFRTVSFRGRVLRRTPFACRWLLAAACVVLGAAGCEGEADPFEAADRAAIPEAMRAAGPETYPVTLEPGGTLHLRRPPGRIVAHRATEAEIVVALGRGDALVGMFDRAYLRRMQELFYKQVPGLEVSFEGITDIKNTGGVDKEVFYRLDADMHLIDPRMPVAWWGWDPGDVAEIAERVGPFFGNFIRMTQRWGPDYQRYTLDELFAVYAELLQREGRHRRFAAFGEQAIERIREALPPTDQRPRICVISMASDPSKGRFYLLDLDKRGNLAQHYRDLGLEQADLPEHAGGDHMGVTGYETLLEINPEAIIVQWATVLCADRAAFEKRFLRPLAEHRLGARLRAVKAGRVIPGGNGDQGPITRLFQVEMMAKLLFPERFGEWRWGQTPDEPLFDRDALGRILTGEPVNAERPERDP